MKLINQIIHEIDEFPTLPTIYSTLNEVMANPRSTANDVAAVIQQDQSSASKVLKAVNSSIYGFRNRVNTVSQAVVYLGFQEVKSLVITLSVMNMFSKTQSTAILNPVELWKHSIATGVIARYLAKMMGERELEKYFIAGILHDIGKLLFLRAIPDIYSKALNFAFDYKLQTRDVEKEIIGMSHNLAGKLICEKWKLPVSIINTIHYSHSGLVDGKVDRMVSTVHIANVMAVVLELGKAGDTSIPEINTNVWSQLPIKEGTFVRGLPIILKEYQDSVNLLLTTK